VVDVGGQRTERKKWIHCFEDVKAIIFFVDASAYNMNLFEDERVNRLLESFTLFEEICNCKYFDSTPLILFLNKSDLLKEKILEVDIKDYFEDYSGHLDFL
jgi:signal recognition particle receptor subunit beta